MAFSDTLQRMRRRLQERDGGGSDGQREYWKSVATLATGSLASQLIGIFSMLVIARLYDPVEFGIFAIFAVYAGLLALIATAKYDAAVFMARRPREAIDLTLIAIATSLLLGLLIMLLTPVLAPLLVSETAHPTLFILLLALATASGGAMGAITAWGMQVKAFGAVTQGRVVQSLMTAAIGIGLGLMHWGAMGLILALVVGQIAICVAIAWRLGFVRRAHHFSWRAARARARRNIRFPQYMLLGEGLNFVGNNIIALVTPALFSVTQLGHYNLGQRVSAVPINVVGTAMAGVFRSAVSPQHRASDAEIAVLFRATCVRLCVIGAMLSLPLALAGPQLFAILLGEKWTVAGSYVQILSPLIFIRFVASPLSAMLLLAHRQRLDTVLQTLFVIAAAAAVGTGIWMQSFLSMLITPTVLQTLIYGIYLAVSYRISVEMSAP